MYPANPVAAACHDNPYPYYSDLLKGPALVFDEQLKLWVASRTAVIHEVLGNPHCLVRPSAEPVPSAIAGSSAGAIFAHLVRMNEGNTAHARPRFALQQAFGSVDLAGVGINTRQLAEALAGTHGLPESFALTPWMFDLPTYVVANLLGFDQAELPQLAAWMADFVRCLSPLSTDEQLTAASAAARELLLRFRRLVQAATTHESSLLGRIRAEAALAGWENMDGILANLIGLLSQTHEAAAGLIGNCIVALLTQPQLQEGLRGDPRLLDAMVQEVARFDSPVQNTRRFVAHPTTIAGVSLEAGETILLLLAAAGRDEQSNRQPNEFLLERADRRWFGFGHGRHACPGQSLAFAIAAAAIDSILAMPISLSTEQIGWSYRPSANARLPVFATREPT
jgi:cytochrome P450